MLLNELRADGNNFMQKNFDPSPSLSRHVKHKKSIIERNQQISQKSRRRGDGESAGETGLHECAPRFLVSYA